MRRTPIAILIVVGLLRPALSVAQDSAAAGPACSWQDEACSSTTWSILTLGAVGAALAFETEHPESIRKSLDESSLLDVPMEIGNAYGDGLVVGGLGLTTYAFGALTGRDGATYLGRDLLLSFAWSSTITGVLKHTVDRTRPNGAKYSFPSGHTTAAFSTVPVIWSHLGWETGAGFAVLATMTGLARMEENKHYLSDVVAGAAIGITVGRVVNARRGWRLAAGPGGVTASRSF